MIGSTWSISSMLRLRSSHSCQVREKTSSANDLIRSAILHKLTVIGEAAVRLSSDLKAQHSEVPWTDITGFRNIAVHAYFSIDWGIVWTTATEEIPELEGRVRNILASERDE